MAAHYCPDYRDKNGVCRICEPNPEFSAVVDKALLASTLTSGSDQPAQSAPSAEEWLKSQTQWHCLGYPKCDGDLVGIPHEKECPMFGKEFPSVPELMEAYAALRTAQLADEVLAYQAFIEDYKEKNRVLMRGLESLTPSGSEYVGDADACIEYVKKARRSLHETVKKAIIAKNAAESALAQARTMGSFPIRAGLRG